eukprot:3936748-Rhodomonas_salina.1
MLRVLLVDRGFHEPFQLAQPQRHALLLLAARRGVAQPRKEEREVPFMRAAQAFSNVGHGRVAQVDALVGDEIVAVLEPPQQLRPREQLRLQHLHHQRPEHLVAHVLRVAHLRLLLVHLFRLDHDPSNKLCDRWNLPFLSVLLPLLRGLRLLLPRPPRCRAALLGQRLEIRLQLVEEEREGREVHAPLLAHELLDRRRDQVRVRAHRDRAHDAVRRDLQLRGPARLQVAARHPQVLHLPRILQAGLSDPRRDTSAGEKSLLFCVSIWERNGRDRSRRSLSPWERRLRCARAYAGCQDLRLIVEESISLLSAPYNKT